MVAMAEINTVSFNPALPPMLGTVRFLSYLTVKVGTLTLRGLRLVLRLVQRQSKAVVVGTLGFCPYISLRGNTRQTFIYP